MGLSDILINAALVGAASALLVAVVKLLARMRPRAAPPQASGWC